MTGSDQGCNDAGAVIPGSTAGIDAGIGAFDLGHRREQGLGLMRLDGGVIDGGAGGRFEVDLDLAVIGLGHEFHANHGKQQEAAAEGHQCHQHGDDPVPKRPTQHAAI